MSNSLRLSSRGGFPIFLVLCVLAGCGDDTASDAGPGDDATGGDGDGDGSLGTIDAYDCGDFCSTELATEAYRCDDADNGVCMEFAIGHVPADAHKTCFDLRPELMFEAGRCPGGSAARCEFPPEQSHDYFSVQYYYQGFKGADFGNPDDVEALRAVCVRGLYGEFYAD